MIFIAGGTRSCASAAVAEDGAPPVYAVSPRCQQRQFQRSETRAPHPGLCERSVKILCRIRIELRSKGEWLAHTRPDESESRDKRAVIFNARRLRNRRAHLGIGLGKARARWNSALDPVNVARNKETDTAALRGSGLVNERLRQLAHTTGYRHHVFPQVRAGQQPPFLSVVYRHRIPAAFILLFAHGVINFSFCKWLLPGRSTIRCGRAARQFPSVYSTKANTIREPTLRPDVTSMAACPTAFV